MYFKQQRLHIAACNTDLKCNYYQCTNPTCMVCSLISLIGHSSTVVGAVLCTVNNSQLWIIFTVCISYFLTGETSAGRNSLINLLLGEKLLPSNIQKETMTTCEISHGSEKEIVLHFSNKSEHKRILKGGNIEDQIKEYIQKSTKDEDWCKKIEIMLPNTLLEVRMLLNQSSILYYLLCMKRKVIIITIILILLILHSFFQVYLIRSPSLNKIPDYVSSLRPSNYT